MTKRTYDNLTDALRDLVNEDSISFKKLGDATDVKRQGLMKHYGLTVNVPAKRKGR